MPTIAEHVASWWRKLRARGRLPALPDLADADGFEFRARLDLDVPLDVLSMHGSRVAGATPPAQPAHERFGRWERTYRVLRVGGYARDERHGSHDPVSIDTPVGPMPRAGGAFLRFLKAGRAIVESTATREQRIDRLRELAASEPEFARFAATLGRGFAERFVDAR